MNRLHNKFHLSTYTWHYSDMFQVIIITIFKENWYIKDIIGNVHPRTGHEGSEREYRYSSTLSLTSALDGVGGQRHAPAALPPGKTRYP
jgi:hypothetical protein